MAGLTCSMSVLARPCEESGDPRHEGACYRCGKPITEAPHRDRAKEREILRQMTVGLNLDSEPLSVFASKRADDGQADYGFDFPDLTRDLELEGMQEVGDCVNYVVWRLDGINRGLWEGMDWKVPHLQRALRHIALAFDEIREARG